MIDLEGMPLPGDMPEPGACVRVERPEEGLTHIVLDPPHRKLTVLDGPLLRDLEQVVITLKADASLQGVVIRGRDPEQFAVGADVKAIEAIEDPAQLEKLVLQVHELFAAIADWPVRTVAAVGGPVPGGAFELSMACDRIVASDAPGTRIGLPEVQLGILPAWGGTHRLPRRVGVPKALDAMLTGRLYPAIPAYKAGMVDRLTKSEWLWRVASDMAMGRDPTPRRGRGAAAWLVDRNPLAKAIIARAASKSVQARTRGHYPSPLQILNLAVQAPSVSSPREWARREAQAAAGLATGPVCKSLISIFFASEAAKKLGRPEDGPRPERIERAGVIGGGIMGGGIASVLAERGVATRLVDLDPAAVDAALVTHRAQIHKKMQRKRLQRHDAQAAVDRLDGATRFEGLGRSQIVIEAVAERMEVKRAVFGELAAMLAPDAILATNTSSLSVAAIAEGLPQPERVCGMHFFNPVPKMPLVEIVRGPQTSEEVVTRVAALALAMGKTPVVVRDVAGFLVNRVLGPYLDEAVRLFEDGAEPERVDALMLDFGMPMGPFSLLDEVGFDIAQHAGASLAAAYGERMTQGSAMARIATPDRLGKKSGKGFYVYGGKGRPKSAGDLGRFVQSDRACTLSGQQLLDRMLLPMLNEAARCLEEGVVQSPQMLDLATVFGTGFAPFRGGLLHWADSVGAAEIVARMEAIAAQPEIAEREGGVARFTPADSLRERAKAGRRFFD